MDSLMGVYGKQCENSRCRYPDRRHTSTMVLSCAPPRDCKAWNLQPEVPGGVAHFNAPVNKKKYCEEFFAV